jgi:hypothetical protein
MILPSTPNVSDVNVRRTETGPSTPTPPTTICKSSSDTTRHVVLSRAATSCITPSDVADGPRRTPTFTPAPRTSNQSQSSRGGVVTPGSRSVLDHRPLDYRHPVELAPEGDQNDHTGSSRSSHTSETRDMAPVPGSSNKLRHSAARLVAGRPRHRAYTHREETPLQEALIVADAAQVPPAKVTGSSWTTPRNHTKNGACCGSIIWKCTRTVPLADLTPMLSLSPESGRFEQESLKRSNDRSVSGRTSAVVKHQLKIPQRKWIERSAHRARFQLGGGGGGGGRRRVRGGSTRSLCPTGTSQSACTSHLPSDTLLTQIRRVTSHDDPGPTSNSPANSNQTSQHWRYRHPSPQFGCSETSTSAARSGD